MHKAHRSVSGGEQSVLDCKGCFLANMPFKENPLILGNQRVERMRTPIHLTD